MLGQKFTSTTTLNPTVSTITWEGVSQCDTGRQPGYVSQGMPLTGSYQLYVDGNPYGVPQPVGSTFVVTQLQAGQHKLGAVFLGDDDYQDSTTSSTSTVTVVPAELTVTALNQTMFQVLPHPTFTYGITGFVNGDFFEPSELNPQPTFNCTDMGSSSSWACR